MSINIVERAPDEVQIRHALVSVSDKGGLDTLARALMRLCPDLTIFSTGGTFKALEQALGDAALGRLVQVADYTGQPETQGGLVKTLDFRIYLGLLTESGNAAHAADLERTQSVPIDLVVVNLYPFRETIARAEVTLEQARGNIDIGGPCMIRAAAKNFLRVAAVVDPADYSTLLAELQERKGSLALTTRFRLAQKAFAHTASYDRAIANYLAAQMPARALACYQRA
jgi:phosphoribosylaminoimidazolecarboxamide formyltransferase/IMP cyclohydrolase